MVEPRGININQYESSKLKCIGNQPLHIDTCKMTESTQGLKVPIKTEHFKMGIIDHIPRIKKTDSVWGEAT